ncbi:MAG: hypothetical protein ACRDWH_08310 [Acidimicrobiia bacterium]
MEQVVVRRSGLRMWVLALAGVPMVVIGIDILTRKRLVNAISSVVFGTGDAQLIEPRDVIWAVVILAIGLGLVGFGLRELVAPTHVVKADRDGLHLHLGNPFSRPIVIPWDEIEDVGAEDLDDDGAVVAAMWVRVARPKRLPQNPWGARWLEPSVIAMMASDWERPPRLVAQEVAEVVMYTGGIEADDILAESEKSQEMEGIP